MASPQRFLGNSVLQWNNMAAAAGSVPWHVELMFRTRQASATLLHISSGLQHNLTLQVCLHSTLSLCMCTHSDRRSGFIQLSLSLSVSTLHVILQGKLQLEQISTNFR